MATNRETIRDALVTLLSAALVGAGKLAETCTGSKVTDLTAKTPLVAVFGRGSGRERPPFFEGVPTFYLEIQVLVRQAYTGWTNAEAEDRLDAIEAVIAGVILTNGVTANWRQIDYDGPSEMSEAKELSNGILYFLEKIPVVVLAN